MISKCPNCGGELRYDIGDQLVVCDFCGQKFDPKDLLSRETDKRGARKASAKAKEVPAESPASANASNTMFLADFWYGLSVRT